MTRNSRRRRLVGQFLQSMTPGPRWLLVAVVFFCFAPIGLLSDLSSLGQAPWYRLAFLMVWSGGIAVAFAAAGTSSRHGRTFLVLAILCTVLGIFVERQWLPEPVPPSTFGSADILVLRQHLSTVTGLMVADIALMYTAFVMLMQGEGQRFMRAHTEIRLAREIHRTLAPPVAGETPMLAWHGVSHPSGEVGGDLVDVISDGSGWLACVADVSGHGVAAGVLMGMFKTAFHATAAETPDVGDLVTRANRVITPLRQSNMFVTVACLRMASPRRIEYVLAGHPSLLHVPSGTPRPAWIGESQPAIGFLEDARYETRAFDVGPGDLVLVVTDGLLEVMDRQDRELGAEGFAGIVAAIPQAATLADVEARVYAACRTYGAQADDQTLLALRVR